MPYPRASGSKALYSRQSPSSALTGAFQSAYWIYTEALNNNAPADDKAFRATYTPPSGVSAVTANILITADDYFTLYVNGQVVGDTRSLIGTGTTVWANVHGYAVTLNIKGVAPIVFAVIVSNNANSASGLLAAMQIVLSDGSSTTIASGGGGWRATSSIPQNFADPGLNDSGWGTPVVLSKNGASTPWGPIPDPSSLQKVALSPSQGASSPATSTKPNTPGSTAVSSPTSTQNQVSSPAASGNGSTSGNTGSVPAGGTSSNSSNGGTVNTVTVSGPSGGTGSVIGNTSPAPTSLATASSALSTDATPSSLPSGSGSHVNTAAIAGGVVGGVILIVLLLLTWFLCIRRRDRQPESAPSLSVSSPLTTEVGESAFGVNSSLPTPFPLESSSHVRTGSNSSKSSAPILMRNAWDDMRYQNSPQPTVTASTSLHTRSTSNGTRTDDLNATLAQLQVLTTQLNRGLAEYGANAPRVALAVSNPNEGADPVSPDDHKTVDYKEAPPPLPPPYVEDR